MFDERRGVYPSHINIAGTQEILITIDFIGASRTGLDQYLADLMDIILEKASTRTIQTKHEVGVRDIKVRIIRWPERVSS